MQILRAIKSFIDRLTSKPDCATVVEDTSYPSEDTMETLTNPAIYAREWAMNKVELLHEADRHRNAKALMSEFDEWINLEDDNDEITYIYLDYEFWKEQETESDPAS